MVDLFFVTLFTSALKIVLRPIVIIPLVGMVVSFLFISDKSSRWWVIGLFLLAGIAIELLEYYLSGYREQYLESNLTIYFRHFPIEATGNDKLLHASTFLPSLLILFLLLYGGISFIDLPAIKSPLVLSMAVAPACLLLILMDSYIKVPAWNPNGTPAPKEKFADIHLAARTGDVEALTVQIREKKELLNQQTNKAMAPLHLTVTEGHFEATKFLVESGADVNLMGSAFKPVTPLMMAARNGDRRTLEFLLNNGADPHILTDERNNILYSAKWHPDIFKLLINHKVDYENVNQYGESILSIVAGMQDNFRPHPYAYDLTKYLLELGMPPDGLRGEQEKPLVKAADASNIKVLQLLLEKGADPDAIGKFKSTPLIVSILEQSPEMVRLLLKYGADPNLPGSAPGQYERLFIPLVIVKEQIESEVGMYDEEQKEKKHKIMQTISSLLLQSGAK
jgi:ankyrin repeat protein